MDKFYKLEDTNVIGLSDEEELYKLEIDETHTRAIRAFKITVSKEVGYYDTYFLHWNNDTKDILPPAIGMTAAELKESTWGRPDDINNTTNYNGTYEQWHYPNGKYVYLDNGVVTSIRR